MEEFDLIMRSKLQDAEERVPQGVWQGISSRLDAMEAAGKAPSRHIWGWSVAALAAAAAIAAGIFFRGTTDHNSNLLNNKEELTAHVVPSVPAEERNNAPLQAEALTLSEALPHPSQAAQADRARPAASVKHTAPVQGNTVAIAEEETAQAEETENEVTDNKQDTASYGVTAKDRAQSAAEVSAYETDPFAALEAEDARAESRKVKIAAVLGGSMSGNNSSASTVNYGAEGNSYSNLQETSTSSYGIPVSVGAGLRFAISPRWAIGTGVDYSMLTRTFSGIYRPESGVPVNGEVRHTVQYIGIPLNIYYNAATTKNFRFYLFGGGQGEWCISNRYKVLESPDNAILGSKVDRPLLSVGAGLGLELMLGSRVGIFIDPSVRYYFDSDQPKSIRTEKPFNINFQTGLRFDF